MAMRFRIEEEEEYDSRRKKGRIVVEKPWQTRMRFSFPEEVEDFDSKFTPASQQVEVKPRRKGGSLEQGMGGEVDNHVGMMEDDSGEDDENNFSDEKISSFVSLTQFGPSSFLNFSRFGPAIPKARQQRRKGPKHGTGGQRQRSISSQSTKSTAGSTMRRVRFY